MKRNILLTVLLIIVITLSLGFYFKNKNQKKDESEKKVNLITKKPLEKLKVQTGWLLNGEFANICSAIVEGYYKDEGIDIELKPGGPAGASFIISTNAIAQDLTLDIGIEGDLVPLLRGITKENENERLKVKAFASFWNENPYGFIVRADSGINSLKDFIRTKKDGTKYKIGVTADSVIQYAIAEYAGVPVKDINLVTVGYDATPFLTGQVDALAAYWTTQAYEVEKAGIPYKFLSVSEMPGFSQPSMIAIATENTLKNKSESLTKWLKATIKGSEFVLNNPEKAAEHILDKRCGGPSFNKEQEGWLIKKSLPLFEKGHIGSLNKEQIMKYAASYYNLKQIPRMPKEEEVIDTTILDQIK